MTTIVLHPLLLACGEFELRSKVSRALAQSLRRRGGGFFCVVFISATFISSFSSVVSPLPTTAQASNCVQTSKVPSYTVIYIVFPLFGKGPISLRPLQPARPSPPPPFRFAGLERSRSVSDSLSLIGGRASEEGEGGTKLEMVPPSPPRPTQATRCRERRRRGKYQAGAVFREGTAAATRNCSLRISRKKSLPRKRSAVRKGGKFLTAQRKNRPMGTGGKEKKEEKHY